MGLLDMLGIDPQAGGLLGNIGSFANNNSNALIGLGAGIASGANSYGNGWGPGIQQGLQGFMGGRQADQKLQIQQASLQALMQQGLTPQQAFLAINNPEYMKASAANVFPKFAQFANGQQYGNFNEANGQTNVTGVAPKFETLSSGQIGGFSTPPMPGAPPPITQATGSTAPIVPNMVPTTSIRPPPAPSFTQTASGGPQNPPEGYAWDPKNPSALVPIQGGPAGKVPATEAAYLAMMQASKAGVEQAKQYFLSPEFKSGVLDTAGKAVGQATGSFDIGRHQRAVGLATEAALRIASGAAVPESEVKRYANFYTPSVYDDIATRTQKIDALQRFMAYAERNMGNGRAMPPPDAFMPGGAASGPPKEQGRMSQGGAWPPPPSGFTLVQ